MATAQHLTDFALGLKERGHEVTVVTSNRAYDNPGLSFPNHEHWRGIEIHRIKSTGFGKGAKWKRATDFASFLVICSLRTLFLRRHDVIVALTSPPLISFLAALIAKLKGSRFIYWVMDLNPDEAVAAGWLNPRSLVFTFLDSLSRFSFRRADKIIALDRFMRDRILAKGIPSEKIEIIAPWSHEDTVKFDPRGREQFRKEQGIDGVESNLQDSLRRFVVMYSGNHSPCHPLETLLEAAKRVGGVGNELGSSIAFYFVGGGSEWRKIQNAKLKTPSSNIHSLPYQPLPALAGSLSAADFRSH